ncbi:MAG: polysaccharide biosynthesis/export family protein, partial [Verrucomicrobiota bacterium]|nr:polysaccharide biosynthesis/export family protein [Verrucomicrobiota bacterium]
MKKQFILALLGFTLILVGCQHPGPRFEPRPLALQSATNQFQTVAFTNRVHKEWLQMPTNEFTLGPGDKLEIEILNDPKVADPNSAEFQSSRVSTSVGPDGKIYFSLLPGLDVWGLTLNQTRDLIEKELSKYIRQTPLVAITLRGVESKRIWLLGRFQTPGVYPMTAPMTLLEALSLGGGTLNFSGNNRETLASLGEELADLRRSFIIRQGKMLPIDFQRLLKEGDLSQNIYLQPDDFVYLPGATAREIYTMGALAQPKQLPYVEKMTLVSAIAGAGGTIK